MTVKTRKSYQNKTPKAPISKAHIGKYKNFQNPHIKYQNFHTAQHTQYKKLPRTRHPFISYRTAIPLKELPKISRILENLSKFQEFLRTQIDKDPSKVETMRSKTKTALEMRGFRGFGVGRPRIQEG